MEDIYSPPIRLIASYLPQFYPTKENDKWWEKGFTEWTNVRKAKPLFKGHYQPRVPADLGYYDLRQLSVREQQAKMAKDAGIEGFCYWHYWFGNNRRLLDKVFTEVVDSGKPDFPFCLGWANESWKGISHGANNRMLMEQLYPGVADYEAHFYALLKAFQDSRYIRVNGKPLFMVYKTRQLPNPKQFIDLWRNLASKNGINDIFFVGQTNHYEEYNHIIDQGFDAVNIVRLYDYHVYHLSIVNRILIKVWNKKNWYNYEDAAKYFVGVEEQHINCIPTIIPNWDHSPRSGKKAYILHGSTPELFRHHVKDVFNVIQDKDKMNRISFIKSWNEWGEGNYLEPDKVFGQHYLDVLKEELNKMKV